MSLQSQETYIFKILRGHEAAALAQDLVFVGSAADRADGYIHLSTAAQARETAAKHFVAESGLWLAAVATAPLGDLLRWEPSRGGASFPHLYGPLPVEAVAWLRPLPLDAHGRHVFAEPFPEPMT